MELTDWDYEGYGVYDEDEYASAQGGNFGQPQGPLPPLPQLVVTDGGLQVVESNLSALALQAYNATSLSISSQTASTIRGTASVVVNVLGSGWASSWIGKGYVVMVEIASVESGASGILISNSPQEVRASAQSGAPYVIIGGPPAVVAAARAVPIVEPCPDAMVMTPTGCQPIPGGVDDGPKNGIQKAEAGLPQWVVPVAVGVGALAIAAYVMNARSKRRA